MIPTVPYIQAKFKEFNALYFKNQLPDLPIRMGTARRSLGGVHFMKKRNIFGKETYSNFKLVMSTRFDLPEREVEDTLIHEMIHYYILVNQWHDTAPHGELFQKMMNDINRQYGRHITITHKMTSEMKDQDHLYRMHYICISQLADGRTGLTSASKTRVFELWRNLPRFFDLKQMTWYGTTDPYFNRFSRAIKPKIYIVDEAEVRPYIEKAVRLVMVGDTIRPAREGE